MSVILPICFSSCGPTVNFSNPSPSMLIQHFGISNPSPSYIERVALAYEAGTYTAPGGTQFGDGKYSNLDAVGKKLSFYCCCPGIRSS